MHMCVCTVLYVCECMGRLIDNMYIIFTPIYLCILDQNLEENIVEVQLLFIEHVIVRFVYIYI